MLVGEALRGSRRGAGEAILAESPALRRGLALGAGLAVVIAFAALDGVLDAPDYIVITPVVLGPFIASLLGTPRETAVVALAAIVAGLSSGTWNDDFGDGAFVLRLGVIIVAGGVAVWGAQARERLATTEAQLTAALGGLAEAVTVQAADGGLVYANAAAARFLGFDSPEELVNTPMDRMTSTFRSFTEDGRPLDLEQAPGRRVLRGEEPDPLVVRWIDLRTGEERWSVTKASAVRDRQGHVRMAVNVIEDMTEVKRAELAQRLLAQAGAALASSLDFEATLGQVARLAVPELADWCTVSLPDERHGLIRQVALAHADPAKVEFGREYYRRFPSRMSDAGGLAAVLREGRSELFSRVTDEQIDATIADPEQRRLLRDVGMRSAMIVPMVAAGRTIGAISFVTAESGRSFGPADLALAEELGRRAGTAVENARMYTERSYIARTLQAGLLPPQLPEIPGFKTATLYRPAGAENWVGGDFYDAFAVRGGWLVLVGDVVGRGADAAALTALARYTLRASGRLLASPLDAVHELNRELLERGRPGIALCTVCLVLLRETRDGDARADVVCTGHPPPLIARGGSVRPVDASGPMLGVDAQARWEPTAVALAPDDLLVLYTDGVLDARGEDDRFGEERLAATVADASDARDAVRRINAALERFRRGSEADDTAVVAVSRAPVASIVQARQARASPAQ
jgi:PAS domain S-box-containing protein